MSGFNSRISVDVRASLENAPFNNKKQFNVSLEMLSAYFGLAYLFNIFTLNPKKRWKTMRCSIGFA